MRAPGGRYPHDRLVHPRLLTEARSGRQTRGCGESGAAGKTNGNWNSPVDDRTYARQGKTVCRLKGGDPLSFGRGGEESRR